MRNFIDLVAEAFGRPANMGPETLFHGTSEGAWKSIQRSDMMMAMEDTSAANSISVTANRKVAERFARQSAMHDMEDEGVVISFNTDKLLSLYKLVPFHDPDLSTAWDFDDEEEWRIEKSKVYGILKAVQHTYRVHLESGDEFHEPRSTWNIIQDAVSAEFSKLNGQYAGNCEGAAGDLANVLRSEGVECEMIEGRYDQPMEWGDGETHPWTPHCWVETDKYILDPTRRQFGPSLSIIVKKADPDSKLYVKERVIELTDEYGL